MHLKPDLEITTRIINRDQNLMVLMCISIIIFTIYAYIEDLSYFGVYLTMSIVAFLFLGSKADIPDETWSPQEKGAWTRRYTTLKLKEGQLIYVSGDRPDSRESFDMNTLKEIEYRKKKLILHFNDLTTRTINAKYWNPNLVKDFIESINAQLSSNL